MKHWKKKCNYGASPHWQWCVISCQNHEFGRCPLRNWELSTIIVISCLCRKKERKMVHFSIKSSAEGTIHLLIIMKTSIVGNCCAWRVSCKLLGNPQAFAVTMLNLVWRTFFDRSISKNCWQRIGLSWALILKLETKSSDANLSTSSFQGYMEILACRIGSNRMTSSFRVFFLPPSVSRRFSCFKLIPYHWALGYSNSICSSRLARFSGVCNLSVCCYSSAVSLSCIHTVISILWLV